MLYSFAGHGRPSRFYRPSAHRFPDAGKRLSEIPSPAQPSPSLLDLRGDIGIHPVDLLFENCMWSQ